MSALASTNHLRPGLTLDADPYLALLDMQHLRSASRPHGGESDAVLYTVNCNPARGSPAAGALVTAESEHL